MKNNESQIFLLHTHMFALTGKRTRTRLPSYSLLEFQRSLPQPPPSFLNFTLFVTLLHVRRLKFYKLDNAALSDAWCELAFFFLSFFPFYQGLSRVAHLIFNSFLITSQPFADAHLFLPPLSLLVLLFLGVLQLGYLRGKLRQLSGLHTCTQMGDKRPLRPVPDQRYTQDRLKYGFPSLCVPCACLWFIPTTIRCVCVCVCPHVH